MWSKKNKEKEEKTVMRTNQTQSVTQTIRTFEQRSQSVYYTSETKNMTPTSSLSRLDNKAFLALPTTTNKPKSSSTTNLGGRVSVDARPVVLTPSINLNYQSPYRNTPAYSSFQHRPTVATTTPYRRPLPSIEQPIKTPPEPPNKRLTVKKTGQFHDSSSAIPTYQTHSKNRGEVLIINNVMFKDKGYRNGARVDDKKMKDVFQQMGFRVTVERDLKKSGMESKVRSFSKRSSLFSADIAILVVMSHGTRNEALGGTEVFGLDEEGILVDELLENFTDASCKAMKDKPKIFIFQCCRGDNEQFVESDSKRIPSKVPVLADSLIAYSTLPGFVSHRDPIGGTWYISTLCDVLSEHAHEYHIEDLLKMVDVKLGAMAKSVQQRTHYENRGFKRCYLHPK